VAPPPTLGPRIKRLRLQRGWTQVELGARAKITGEYVTLIEGGKRTGTVAVLQRLATALGVPLGDLLGLPRSERRRT